MPPVRDKEAPTTTTTTCWSPENPEVMATGSTSAAEVRVKPRAQIGGWWKVRKLIS
jgi:hypothetical protein